MLLKLAQQQTNLLSNLACMSFAKVAKKKVWIPKTPFDVVICSAYRTPLTKSNRGPLKDTPLELMVAPLFQHTLKTLKLDPKKINDIVLGNVLWPGAGAYNFRFAQLLAGIPHETTVMAVNRICSSGLEAIAIMGSKIKSGLVDIGFAGGAENMSIYDMGTNLFMKDPLPSEVFNNKETSKCLISMGETAEIVAQKFKVTRKEVDQMAMESHKKASIAQQKNLFKDEIVPIKVKVKDKNNIYVTKMVKVDDGVRKETTLESLAKLKPVFKKNGVSTAGNCSQVCDGAAVVLMTRRSLAQKMKLPILARLIDYSVKGCPPEIMGIGPAIAIPDVLKKTGLTKEDISIFEINEAFGSQAVYCVKKLGINMKKVNPKGGAIALGHPLGATGARQVCTLLHELKRTKGKYGIVSMCIGSGMGAAAIFENENL